MNCANCNDALASSFKFCPNCGTAVPQKHQLPSNVKYQSPFGIWLVTTEGDCEGRSTKTLGVFEGYIDDIARSCADQCCYSLCFHATSTQAKLPRNQPVRSVHITLDIDSGTWNMAPNERAKSVALVFKDRPVRVEPSNYYASVKLVWKD